MRSGTVNLPAIERVTFGRPAAEAVDEEVTRIGAQRVFILASATLNRQTGAVAAIRDALGARFAGLVDHMPAHSPRDAIVAAADAAREAGADLILTVGGGSVTDAAKVMQICLAEDIRDPDGLERTRVRADEHGVLHEPALRAPVVRQITVPTTLSGGEFNPLGGATDTKRGMKFGHSHPLLVPRAIILDPALTRHTPDWLFLSTGIRAVDHAVETLCSHLSNDWCDGLAAAGLALLVEGLRRVAADADDVEARLKCQVGMWQAITPVVAGVPMGASHAIGHILGGSCGVPHGHTSCVMLPAVLRWNAPVNADRQTRVAAILGDADRPAADLVHELIAGLGQPRSLAAVGVEPDRFDLVARNTMHDIWARTNPRPIDGPEQVREILELAA